MLSIYFSLFIPFSLFPLFPSLYLPLFLSSLFSLPFLHSFFILPLPFLYIYFFVCDLSIIYLIYMYNIHNIYMYNIHNIYMYIAIYSFAFFLEFSIHCRTSQTINIMETVMAIIIYYHKYIIYIESYSFLD